MKVRGVLEKHPLTLTLSRQWERGLLASIVQLSLSKIGEPGIAVFKHLGCALLK
jgi:hypothetical protein